MEKALCKARANYEQFLGFLKTAHADAERKDGSKPTANEVYELMKKERELYVGLFEPSFLGVDLEPYCGKNGSPYFSFETYFEMRSAGKTPVGLQWKDMKKGGHNDSWDPAQKAWVAWHDILHLFQNAPHESYNPEIKGDREEKHRINKEHACSMSNAVGFSWSKIKGIEDPEVAARHTMALYYVDHEFVKYEPENAYNRKQKPLEVIQNMCKHSLAVSQGYLGGKASTMDHDEYYDKRYAKEGEKLFYVGPAENCPPEIYERFVTPRKLMLTPLIVRCAELPNGDADFEYWEKDSWASKRRLYHSIADLLKCAGVSPRVYGETYEMFNAAAAQAEVDKLLTELLEFVSLEDSSAG